MTPVSLRVAVVLYRNDVAQVDRLVESLDRALARARGAGAVGDVRLHLGDSSPAPVLTRAPDVASVNTTYDVFGANLGHSGGVNRLLADLSEDVALLVNPDVVVAPDAVVHLLRAIADETVAVADARQLPFEHPKPHDPATGDAPWASMATCVVRRAAWEQVGPLDEDLFPMHGNDVDFSWRARVARWRVVHAPAARVFHDKRLSAAGAVLPSEVEEEHGARAALLLAFRYSRPDVVTSYFEILESGTPAQRRGAAYVRDLLAHGPLPELLDPGHEVAEFVGGDFAAHRF